VNKVSAHIIRFIDFFYTPFKRIMPEKTFRYAACGAANTVLGLAMYYVCFYYFLQQQNFDIVFFAFKPHIAALFFSFCISFGVGFIFMKYIVFVDSNVKGKIQLFRYFSVFAINLCINYLMLKLLVELLHWPAMFSQIITTLIVIIISYLAQTHFTFKVKK
jgi:putative flippase GtrA